MPALILTTSLKAVTIANPAPGSAFAIDPNRTQQLPPSGFATGSLSAAVLVPTPTPTPTPFASIDPNRTQQI